jgi:hypothetical protein
VKRQLTRWALGALLGGAALLVTAPVALAGNGTVSGSVTSAASHAGIERVEVRFYKVHNEWSREFTATGGKFGASLEAGEYKVEFVPEASSGYASQYYDDALSYASAPTINVEEGKTLTIEAMLFRSNSISGNVTSAATGHALSDIEVTAYEAQAPNDAIESIDTNSAGNYLLANISRGQYVLEFKPTFEAELNDAPRFFDERATFDEATPIAFGEGEHREYGAKLLEGASISGTVTDAATHQPLAGIIAYAAAAGDEGPVAVTATDANGNYTLPGMASGSIVVAFIPSSKEDQLTYSPQLYDGRSLPEGIASYGELFAYGTPVQVTAGAVTTGIDAAMVRREPASTAAPVISGTPAVGQTLSCADGLWTGIGKLEYTRQWLRDGTPIAGASGSTYAVQAADVGHGLSCEVTAKNEIGSVNATSNVLTVPLPIAAVPDLVPPTPRITLSTSKLTVSKGSARVPLTCAVASCAGSLELSERLVVKHRKGRRTITKQETLVLGKGAYTLAAGHSAMIAVRLTASAQSELARDKHHELSAKVLVSVSGGKTVSETVLLSEAPPAKRHDKHK